MQKYFVLFLIAACSITVVASEIVAYNTETVAVLQATSHCANDLAMLSKDGLIETATWLKGEDSDVYTLNFTAGGFAPSFKTFHVGTLTITKTFVKSENTAPDAPGGQFVYACNVTK